MPKMRRVLLCRHSRFFYFLFLILCIPPATNKDDGCLLKHQEKWRYFCKQSDFYGQPAPSFILESFVAKESPSPGEPNQILNKTLWALKDDEEVWHGELIDTWQHAELISNALLSHKVARWSNVQNSSKSLQALMSSADGREHKGGKGMLVMHCNLSNSNTDSTGCNESGHLKPFDLQSTIRHLAEEALVEKVQVLIHPTSDISHTMAFQVHNRCSWPHEGHASSAFLSFLNEKKAVQTLELNFNSSLFPSLRHNTLKEHINRLLDERTTRHACNQGMSGEFTAKNMKTFPLQVHSLMIKGVNSEMNGFKVDNFGDFYLGPGQSTRLHVSYWPDLKTGITNGELQLVTSAGTFSVTLKANVPKHIQILCQNAALIARAKKIILQVCSLALFLVLLVFGRMLKQEGVMMSDVNQWSTSNNAVKPSQRDTERSMQHHVNKRASLYVSINIGCTHDESKQCGLSLTKVLDVVYAAINCIVGLKLLYVSHASNVQQPEMNIRCKSDFHTQPEMNIRCKSDFHTQHSSDTTSPTSSMMGKRRASSQSRACIKSASTTHGGGALSFRGKAAPIKNLKADPGLEIVRVLGKTGPEPPLTTQSDKDREKTKQKKKKKGASSVVPWTDRGSDSGSSSPLSMPSSPVMREETCRPVSPLGSRSHIFPQPLSMPSSPVAGKEVCRLMSPSASDTHTSIQKCKMPVQMDATIMIMSDESESKESLMHHSSNNNFSVGDDGSLQGTENSFISGDSQENTASHSGNFPKCLYHGNRSSEANSVVKTTEMNLVKIATVRNSSKGTEVSRARCATLTASATFPAPGRRSLQESIFVRQDGQNGSIAGSSSSLDLVSTSMMAPHARAPGSPLALGSPLSPKSPYLSRKAHSSLFTAPPSSSHQHMQQGNPRPTVRSWQKGDFEGSTQHTQETFYRGGWGRCSPHQMHEPRHAQKRQDSHRGSDSVIWYDIWGDHFADLGKRWGSYWIGKDTPITRKASSLPPLLQTPPFSVFSRNDPFNR